MLTLRIAARQDQRISIEFGDAATTAPAAIDPTYPNRRVILGDELQSLLDAALARGCEVIELLRLSVTARVPLGGIVLRDATLERVALVSCEFSRGLTLERLSVKHCRLVQISGGTGTRSGLRLSDSRFEHRLFLSTNSHGLLTDVITLRGAVLEQGASMTVDCARLDLARCTFGSRSLISAYEDALAAGRQTEVLSMMHATVRDLTLSGMSMRYCRLRDAHGLDTVHFDRCRWPRSFGLVRRRVTYEEKLFRHSLPLNGLRVFTAPVRWPWAMLRPPAVGGWSGANPIDLDRLTSARQVHDVYKALERGAAHDGDHAVAADYAWGAYTMRRLGGHTQAGGWARSLARAVSGAGIDRAVIRAYRVLGGYGLRARWPLAWLVVLWLSFALMMGSSGFASSSVYCQKRSACWTGARGEFDAPRLGRAFVHSTSTALSLSRPSPGQVRSHGMAAIVLTRILTVLLLGFAALALRSRVRR